MGWVTEHAPQDVDVATCVTCGLCLPYCPTYLLTGDESASPRGRLAAMAAVSAGVVEVDERFDEVMSYCLQCRACEAVCPSAVPFGRAMEGARAELQIQRPSPQRRLRRLVFGRAIGHRWIVDAVTAAAFAAQRMGLTTMVSAASGLRPLRLTSGIVGRAWDPEGEPVGTVALLAGCVMDAWFPAVHEALVGVLRTAGYRVEVPEGQTCCGALAAHEGAAVDAARLAAQNVEAFAGYDRIVADAAGCGAHLRDYADWAHGGAEVAGRVADANEIVADLIAAGNLPTFEGRARGAVAVQDPCHLRHAQRITEAPRAVLRAAGFEPVDIDPRGVCCGAAGAYTLSHPETSAALGRQKANQVVESGTSIVATANPGCDLQLRRYLGSGVRVVHPVELYWESLRGR